MCEDNRRRVTLSQLESLWESLNSHRGLISGHNKSCQAREYAHNSWTGIAAILNAHANGAEKDWKGWSRYWNDYKCKLKSRIASVRNSQSRTDGGTAKELTEIEDKFLGLLGDDFGVEISGPRVDPLKSSPNFTLIMRSCTALLRSLGRAAERVIDHAAFQQILALTSLTAAERARVTGQAVRAAMDDDHDYCAEIDMDALGEAGEGDEFPVPMVIKDEVEVTHWQCSCDAIAGRHDDACDAAVVDYLEHFRISPDEATCTICEETLTWTSVETLKEHLSTHPEAAGGDHEDDSDIHPTQEKQAKINQPIIQKPPPPPSPPIMKIPKDVKIIPQNDTPLAETPPANKKRKIEPIEDNEPITIKHDPSTLDRFKSLDQFGLYVASLLKLLPKDKCIKYQNQIVDRLLKDQAAAA
ncbi:uncharacterized protein LOC105388478 isoform X1 [Plutella xylostella]|uniref:uncharacterized protein LOC105388478 isoform X1 n=1 Tax=Plutella xylostella TaxID=51655 RepID=UPI0020328122|nr:uncharacterized protein LOC105388478 isoform X1 [Plutella xylostella]